MKIQQELNTTIVLITHDVDEAVLLSDRVLMMTNGPAATVGEILRVDLPRPRNRVQLAEESRYHHMRQQILHFLYEKTAESGLRSTTMRLVIIGNGLAATRLIESLTDRAPGRYAITVIGDEQMPA
ncbi:Bicarbonate transport ATP-binding protein CmpD [Leclercia adecarboxylata]|uniref:Bicarbonate transport ATP-binding protein CmpD n=1 Tax=Leclercia adecarboxylata TaxID=83655 RepID=A0A4U9HWY3_9ENTR|nr:Bicarbonate transport ATP-binding protein CmpD [Leclercia adecarboxylata]